MCQEWVDIDPEVDLVDLIRPDEDVAGRKPVVYAEDGLGQPVVLVHADDPQLRSIAVFDVVINNADRKGGHILVDYEGRVRGCDHGVSFHVDPKLRTILWGWSGEPLRDEDVDLLQRLRSRAQVRRPAPARRPAGDGGGRRDPRPGTTPALDVRDARPRRVAGGRSHGRCSSRGGTCAGGR